LRALIADELRRYTPHSLSACLWGFWQFVIDSRQEVNMRVFNPEPVKEGWRAEGSVIELYGGRNAIFAQYLAYGLVQRGGYDVSVLMDVNIALASKPLFSNYRTYQKPVVPIVEEYRTLIHIELADLYEGEELHALETCIHDAIGMLKKVVDSFPRMQTLVREAAQKLIEKMPKEGDAAVLRMEAHAFLQWLMRGHFTFLAR
jgi:glutamate dehydrogenase